MEQDAIHSFHWINDPGAEWREFGQSRKILKTESITSEVTNTWLRKKNFEDETGTSAANSASDIRYLKMSLTNLVRLRYAQSRDRLKKSCCWRGTLPQTTSPCLQPSPLQHRDGDSQGRTDRDAAEEKVKRRLQRETVRICVGSPALEGVSWQGNGVSVYVRRYACARVFSLVRFPQTSTV